MKNTIINRENEPVWNAENMNKKKGDSTFVICGWCEYACESLFRYNCMLKPKCDLLNNYHGDTYYGEMYWDTKCMFKLLSQNRLKDIICSKKSQIKKLEDQIVVIQSRLKNDVKREKNISKYEE